MDMDYGLILPLSVIILVLIVGNIAYVNARYKDSRSSLIAVWLLLYAIYVFFVPAIYGAFSDFQSTKGFGITPGQLILVYFFEIGFIVFLLIAFHNRFAGSIGRSANVFVTRLNGKAEVNILLFFSFMLLVLQLDQVLGGMPSYGRILQYDASAQMQGNSFLGLPTSILAPLTAVFYAPGKIAAALLVTMPYNAQLGFSYSKFTFRKTVAMCALAIVGIYGLTVGVRHVTLGVFMLVFVAGLLQKRYKYILYFALGMVLMIVVGPLVGSTYRVFLSQSSSSGLSMKARLSVLSEMKEETIGNRFSMLWDEIGIRLVDARLSCGLLQYVEREGHVGLKPLMNTISAPIPRVLWHTKPAPRSCDGTHKGLAGFVVWNELIGREWGMWGGYTAAAHSWWEFDLPGIIICAVVYGVFLRVILESTSNKGYIGLLIFMLSVNVESFDSFFLKSLPDLCLFVIQRLIPILILVKLWRKLGSRYVEPHKEKRYCTNRKTVLLQ